MGDAGGYSKKVKHLNAIEFPEILSLAKELMEGKYPYIATQLRALKGTALGVFSHYEGFGTGDIGLKADIFKDPVKAAKGLSPRSRTPCRLAP